MKRLWDSLKASKNHVIKRMVEISQQRCKREGVVGTVAGLLESSSSRGLSEEKPTLICLFPVATTKGPSWVQINIHTYKTSTTQKDIGQEA